MWRQESGHFPPHQIICFFNAGFRQEFPIYSRAVNPDPIQPCLTSRSDLPSAPPGHHFWLNLIPALDLTCSVLFLRFPTLARTGHDLACYALDLILTLQDLDLNLQLSFQKHWSENLPSWPWFLPWPPWTLILTLPLPDSTPHLSHTTLFLYLPALDLESDIICSRDGRL